MELDTAKGTRDIGGKEQLVREYVVSTVTQIFKKYGFTPLETPLIERRDVLAAKFAAGEDSDALKETYKLTDNGDRELALRFDLTVPLCRYVGMNRTMKMPFKRYQIGKAYRDAPVKVGRYREFTQIDCDIIGAKSYLADVTCLQIALDVYKALGLDVKIRINDRKLLTWLIKGFTGVDDTKIDSIIISIDKLDKIGFDGVVEDLKSKGFDGNKFDSFFDSVKKLDSFGDDSVKKLKFIEQYSQSNFSSDLENSKKESLQTLFAVFNLINDERIVFDPFLARGLGYYTGIIFEVEDATGAFELSIGGGGRYDNIIGDFLESTGLNRDREYPAVGVSFGLDRIINTMQATDSLPEGMNSAVDVFIIPIGDAADKCITLANTLRAEGIAVDIDLMGRNLSKNLTACNKQNIPFALIIGEDEIASKTYSFRNLKTGTEEKLSVEEVIKKLKN